MQMNILKVIYLNCGERYEDMIDSRRYTHNLSSCELNYLSPQFKSDDQMARSVSI